MHSSPQAHFSDSPTSSTTTLPVSQPGTSRPHASAQHFSPSGAAGSAADLGRLWADTVRRRGAAPFLTFITRTGDSNTWSYRQFDQLVRLTADRFGGLGVGPGRTVHLDLENSPAFVMSWLACASLGAVAVTSDPAAEVPALLPSLSDTRPVLGVVGLQRRWTYRNAVSRSAVPELAVLEVSEDEPDTLAGSPLLTPGPVAGPARRRDDAGHRGRTAGPAAGSQSTGIERPGSGGSPAPANGAAPAGQDADRAVPAGALSVVTAEVRENDEDSGTAPVQVLTHAEAVAGGIGTAAATGLADGHVWFITGDLHTLEVQAHELTTAIAAGASAVLAARFAPEAWRAQARTHGVTHTGLTARRARAVLGEEQSGDGQSGEGQSGDAVERLAALTGVHIARAPDQPLGTPWALTLPRTAAVAPAML